MTRKFARYQVSRVDPTQADAASASIIITVDQPDGSVAHVAGWLGFGPDGYLYANVGDGTSQARAEDINVSARKRAQGWM